MVNELEELLQLARETQLTSDEQEEQRRSFAYGNAKIENARITRETVNQQAEALDSTAER